MSGGPTLPEDLLILIFGFLHPHDVLTCRTVSKSFHDLTKARTVWNTQLYTHIIHRNRPVPGLKSRSLESLNALELQNAVLRALRYCDQWTAEYPKCNFQHVLAGIDVHDHGVGPFQVAGLHLLSWRLLLSVALGPPSSATQRRKMLVRCWDVDLAPPVILAHAFLEFDSWKVNSNYVVDGGSIDGSRGALAILLNSSIEIWDLDPNHQTGFRVKSRFKVDSHQQISRIQAFHGTLILTETPAGVLSIWDLQEPGTKLTLVSPLGTLNEPQAFLDSIIDGEVLVIAKSRAIEGYSLESLRIPFSASRQRDLPATYVHNWQWAVDSISLSSIRTGGINILLRWSTYYPWPINMLHYYILRQNTGRYAPGVEPDAPHVNYHLQFPPTLAMTIGAPVRLLSPYSMTVGKYGTAVWTDSHTEEYFRQSDTGQRLAGVMLNTFDGNAGEGWGSNAIDAREEMDPSLVSHRARMVFDGVDHDAWVKVAVDDEEGRIALALDGGRILLKNYA